MSNVKPDIDLVLVNAGGRSQIYQSLASELTAVEPPVWAGLMASFVRQRRLHGRGIGWIDAHLLASSLVGRLRLWTADPRLASAAQIGSATNGSGMALSFASSAPIMNATRRD